MTPLDWSEEIGKVFKGLYSGVLAGLGSLATVLTGGGGFSDVTAGQWVLISGLSLAALGGTYGLSGWTGPTVGTRNGHGK